MYLFFSSRVTTFRYTKQTLKREKHLLSSIILWSVLHLNFERKEKSIKNIILNKLHKNKLLLITNENYGPHLSYNILQTQNCD